ncbi:MAG: fibronectin type III domain-containing protein [Chloroflexaceae bacterium]|nr:fibronectin type III domain-containing protein [Chloroflexaceae bacterium]
MRSMPAYVRRLVVALVLFMVSSSSLLYTAMPSSADEPITLQALDVPSNIACLPFPQAGITEFNGSRTDGPATTAANQTTITWKDEADDATHHRVYRRAGNGDWTMIAEVAVGTILYTDTGLDEDTTYRYLVRAYDSIADEEGSDSNICRKPSFFESENFVVFYRTDDCPAISDLDGNNRTVCVPSAEVAQRMASLLEGSRAAFLANSFTDPLTNVTPMAVDLFPCDGVGCARGGSSGYMALSPSSMITAYDPVTGSGQASVWTPLHELFHKQQGVYGGINDPTGKWITEGQARAIQDRFCVGTDQNNCISMDEDDDPTKSNYLNDVDDYLDLPSQSLLDASYRAALFWTYLMEQYGTSTAEPERGIDFMRTFLETARDEAGENGNDGITLINLTLAEMVEDDPPSFRDVWKNFVIANFAKELSSGNIAEAYRYIDTTQPGGNYTAVNRNLSTVLTLGDEVVDTNESVSAWGARYYEIFPDASVPIIDVTVQQETNVPLFFVVLGVDNGDIVYEYTVEAPNLSRTFANNDFDQVMLIVAGMQQPANYLYSFNLTQPVLRIQYPTTANPAVVEDESAPGKFEVGVELLSADLEPLDGVELGDFSFQVGTQTVPAGNILSSFRSQQLNLFLLRAPTQTSGGLYDLQVDYAGGALTATQADAVSYNPRDDTDNIVIIDRSGSMGGDGKLAAAQDAARFNVDTWRQVIRLVWYRSTKWSIQTWG